MRRKTKDQTVQRFGADRPPAEFGKLASQALRWATDHAVTLGNANPAMPTVIGNRAADNWRPLLSVADAAGEEWAKLAREAAKQRTRDEDEIRVRLLRDIREVFTLPAMHSCDLVQKLNAIEDAPWSEFQKGKSLSQSKLSCPKCIESARIRCGCSAQRRCGSGPSCFGHARNGLNGGQFRQFGSRIFIRFVAERTEAATHIADTLRLFLRVSGKRVGGSDDVPGGVHIHGHRRPFCRFRRRIVAAGFLDAEASAG
jgi:hypothetical protein